ncbi:MAG: hypothetical protein R3189_05540 [Thiomicrorhabdus chilensis]|uniref:hypothetical protein n=1 Tax=Thiomicrorhabdus chilensis TaxID=63656 RepID=UPI00299EBCA0|nr:hypothetical protein [Thiomicrorhabdus chilensis]MDX1347694.1 hypothetical protein [Thiomicrorhabdus chilensis]
MKKLLVALLASGLMAGCTATQEKAVDTKAQEVVQTLNNDDLYVVYHDGRMNVFYDADLYKEFMQIGETSYRKTFIGAGPKGETVVHGLTKADKKKLVGIPSIEMMEERMPVAENFYGEIIADGRINVFSDWGNFKAFMAHGEVPYRLTDIGAGPKGETVVYALTKESKKKRPEALIAKFKAFHGMK